MSTFGCPMDGTLVHGAEGRLRLPDGPPREAVYSDETLFQAEIGPEAKVADLDEERVERLFRSLDSVLETAIGAKADPERLPRDWLLRRRKEGAECLKCGGEIRRIVVSGRGCYHCPSHQEG